METLILTGWGWLDYATAAVVALRHYKNAKAKGMSRRRLPEFLSECAKEPCSFKRIVIVGIAIYGEPQELLKIFKRLKKHNIEVSWLSVIPLPEWMPDEIRDYLDVQIGDINLKLTEFVAEYFNEGYNDLIPVMEEDKGNDFCSLLKAAQYQYRNYQKPHYFSEALESLALKAVRLSNSQSSLLEHYRKYGERELKGSSSPIVELRKIIDKVAPKDSARVIIYGESGTGKETVALHMHEKSPRKEEAFLIFNCASTSTNLIESQLFGYVKGAFSGAIKNHDGVFKLADGGTLFLDEIGELSMEIQANILRVLQEGRFTPLGAHQEVAVNVRIIAATNRDLAQMVRENKFREDLFYRLNVIPIYVPPLREHLDDIKEIADNFWYKWHKHPLQQDQIEILKTYNWPGNVRELRNFLEYASVMEEKDFAKLLKHHRQRLEPIDNSSLNWPDDQQEMLRSHAKKIYERYNYNKTHTAKAMGVAPNTLKKYLPPKE